MKNEKFYTDADITDEPTAFQLEIEADHKKSFDLMVEQTLYINDGISVLMKIVDGGWVRIRKPILHLTDESEDDMMNFITK